MTEPETADTDEAERHRARMAKRKAVQDAEVAGKTMEKGLLMVHTGSGKGKSTAAFGLLLRMLGHGRRTAVVQFIKGAWSTGERGALERFGDLVDVAQHGRGLHLGDPGQGPRHRRLPSRLGPGQGTAGRARPGTAGAR